MHAGLPAFAVRQAPRRFGRLVLLFGFGAVSPFGSFVLSASSPCFRMRAKKNNDYIFEVSIHLSGLCVMLGSPRLMMFVACVGVAVPHVDRGCALRGGYSESVPPAQYQLAYCWQPLALAAPVGLWACSASPWRRVCGLKQVCLLFFPASIKKIPERTYYCITDCSTALIRACVLVRDT